MVKFKYKLPFDLVKLIKSTIVNYDYDYICGIMPKGLVGQLKHCSMYMICELENHDGIDVYSNPLAVVARNHTNAMETYVKNTEKENGSILCEIVDRCDNIKVEPYYD